MLTNENMTDNISSYERMKGIRSAPQTFVVSARTFDLREAIVVDVDLKGVLRHPNGETRQTRISAVFDDHGRVGRAADLRTIYVHRAT